MQCLANAVSNRHDVDGPTCTALIGALERAGEWRVAEAALLCMLPVAPFQALARDLFRSRLPRRLAARPVLKLLQDLSQRYVEQEVASLGLSGVAPSYSLLC